MMSNSKATLAKIKKIVKKHKADLVKNTRQKLDYSAHPRMMYMKKYREVVAAEECSKDEKKKKGKKNSPIELAKDVKNFDDSETVK